VKEKRSKEVDESCWRKRSTRVGKTIEKMKRKKFDKSLRERSTRVRELCRKKVKVKVGKRSKSVGEIFNKSKIKKCSKNVGKYLVIFMIGVNE